MKLINNKIRMAIAFFSLLTIGINNNSSIAQTSDVKANFELYQNSIEEIFKAIKLSINIDDIQSDSLSDPETPTSFKDLLQYLPDPPPGWTADKARGETNSFGNYYISQVSQTFRQGNKSIKISIFDSAFNSALYTPFLLATGFSRESTEGYSKGIEIDNIPGREEYNYLSKRGSLNLLVDNRFLVQINGRNIEDIDLRNWWQLIDRTLFDYQ